jgi:hypothetical protein
MTDGWNCHRGTLSAHYYLHGISLCVKSSSPEPLTPDGDITKIHFCQRCLKLLNKNLKQIHAELVAKYEGSGTK